MEDIGRRAWKTASRAAKHMSKHSRIVNPSMEKCIPRFDRSEVILGEMLGSGGFNDVCEVARIDLIEDVSQSEHAKKISSPLQSEHRAFVAKHVFRESSQNCRYAVKFLSVDTIEDPNRFCTGAADLVVVSNDRDGTSRVVSQHVLAFCHFLVCCLAFIHSFTGCSLSNQRVPCLPVRRKQSFWLLLIILTLLGSAGWLLLEPQVFPL